MPLNLDDEGFTGFAAPDEWRQPEAVEERDRRQADAREAKRRQSPFRPIAFGELRQREIKALKWKLDDWMLQGEVSFLAGESEAGKTFLAIDVALRMSLGWPVFGRRTEPGLVIYQIGESEEGLLNLRIPAWNKQFGADLPDNVPFVVLPSKVNLWTQDERDPLGTSSLMREIEDIRGKWPGLPMAALFVDTFNKAFAGGNEIDQRDVARVISNAELIAKTYDCHVPIIHHFPKGGTTLRGHGSLKADVHAVAMISTDKDSKIRTVRFDNGGKLKDGEKSSMQFELKQVKLGEREGDGKPITSCVVLPVGEKAKEREAAAQSAAVRGYETTLLNALFKTLESHGLPAPAALQVAPSVRVVDYAEVRKAFAEMCPIDDLTQHESDDDREDARRKHYAKLKTALKRARDFMTDNTKIIRVVRCADPVSGKETDFAWWTGRPVRGFPQTQPIKPRRAEGAAGDIIAAEGADWINDVF